MYVCMYANRWLAQVKYVGTVVKVYPILGNVSSRVLLHTKMFTDMHICKYIQDRKYTHADSY